MRRAVSTLPGVPETVRALQGRTRQAIVTGASREHVNLTHRSSGLLPFFECIVTSEDYECAKPHPDAYLTALRRMGIAADEALAIEDSPRGASAALAAGLRCLVIPTPLTRLTEFPSGARIETDLRRLVDWLEAGAADGPWCKFPSPR
jgi:HAD superfamily hydrolase (TIGR01509 family)